MKTSLKILLIEDDAIEVMKFKRTVSTLDANCEIIEALNGEEALEILNEKNELPSLILLDLNMPRVNGLEFLSILKSDAKLKYIPTVIISTSRNHSDILESYKIGIAGYIVKPLKYDEYVSKIEKVLSYWGINELIKV